MADRAGCVVGVKSECERGISKHHRTCATLYYTRSSYKSLYAFTSGLPFALLSRLLNHSIGGCQLTCRVPVL